MPLTYQNTASVMLCFQQIAVCALKQGKSSFSDHCHPVLYRDRYSKRKGLFKVIAPCLDRASKPRAVSIQIIPDHAFRTIL